MADFYGYDPSRYTKDYRWIADAAAKIGSTVGDVMTAQKALNDKAVTFDTLYNKTIEAASSQYQEKAGLSPEEANRRAVKTYGRASKEMLTLDGDSAIEWLFSRENAFNTDINDLVSQKTASGMRSAASAAAADMANRSPETQDELNQLAGTLGMPAPQADTRPRTREQFYSNVAGRMPDVTGKQIKENQPILDTYANQYQSQKDIDAAEATGARESRLMASEDRINSIQQQNLDLAREREARIATQSEIDENRRRAELRKIDEQIRATNMRISESTRVNDINALSSFVKSTDGVDLLSSIETQENEYKVHDDKIASLKKSGKENRNAKVAAEMADAEAKRRGAETRIKMLKKQYAAWTSAKDKLELEIQNISSDGAESQSTPNYPNTEYSRPNVAYGAKNTAPSYMQPSGSAQSGKVPVAGYNPSTSYDPRRNNSSVDYVVQADKNGKKWMFQKDTGVLIGEYFGE